jgi:ribosome-binding protein aMBF1 (putative translation factor)
MGKAIKEIREEKQIPMWRLASKTDYTASALYEMEKKPLIFQMEPLYVISDALGIKLSELIQKAEEL